MNASGLRPDPSVASLSFSNSSAPRAAIIGLTSWSGEGLYSEK